MSSSRSRHHPLRTTAKMMLMRDKHMEEQKKKLLHTTAGSLNLPRQWSQQHNNNIIYSPSNNNNKIYSPTNNTNNNKIYSPISNISTTITGSLPNNNTNFSLGSSSSSYHDNNYDHNINNNYNNNLDNNLNNNYNNNFDNSLFETSASPSHNSITPSSATNSISELDTLFEGINDMVANPQLSSTFSEQAYHQHLHDHNDSNGNSIESSMKTSVSCPSIRNQKYNLPTKLDPKDFPDLESYKKEKHNIVEKKRRYKINDCIQELALLLPNSYDVDLNKKKGYILEKSVEYIHKLQQDQEKKAEMEKNNRELERRNRHLTLQLQALKKEKSSIIQQQQLQQQQSFILYSTSGQGVDSQQLTPKQSTPNQLTPKQSNIISPHNNNNSYNGLNSTFDNIVISNNLTPNNDNYNNRNNDFYNYDNNIDSSNVYTQNTKKVQNVYITNDITNNQIITTPNQAIIKEEPESMDFVYTTQNLNYNLNPLDFPGEMLNESVVATGEGCINDGKDAGCIGGVLLPLDERDEEELSSFINMEEFGTDDFLMSDITLSTKD